LELRQNYNPVFSQCYHEFLKLYKFGNWTKAKKLLQKLLEIDPEDGPTKTLESFINNECKGVCPVDW